MNEVFFRCPRQVAAAVWPDKVVQTSKNRVAHYFQVADNAQFPALVEGIAEAYHLTKSNRPSKTPSEKPVFTTIDEYIALFPPEVQEILEQIRQTIRKAAPEAAEKISWQMPTFWQKENLVHFAVLQGGGSGIKILIERKNTKGQRLLAFSGSYLSFAKAFKCTTNHFSTNGTVLTGSGIRT